jgi:hypothetical protein
LTAEIETEGSMEIGAPEGHAEEECLHEESSLETDASMSDIDYDASVQAQLNTNYAKVKSRLLRPKERT